MPNFTKMNELSVYLAYEAFKYLSENGPSISAKEIYDHIESEVLKLDVKPDLLGEYKNHTGPSYLVAMNFKLIGYDKAGLIKKSSPKRGYWTITEEGLKLAKRSLALEVINQLINEKYAEWLEQQPEKLKALQINVVDEVGTNDVVEESISIRQKLLKLDPYEFQDLTAGLLEGMGYFVDFNAPRGKDGGVDLVCYRDPLGADTPRIKVQCKHMPETKISRAQIAQLAGVINNTDEIGIFVTSGFFSNDAKRYAIERNIHIRLIDGQELEDMWAKYYDKIPRDKQELLPILFVPRLIISED